MGEAKPRLGRDAPIDEAELDLYAIHDDAIQIWPWECAPEPLQEGWKEPFPLIVYVPAQFVKHPFVIMLFGRLSTRRREEGDGALVIACDFDAHVP